MFPWDNLFINSIVMIVMFTLFVGTTLVLKPRIWLQDFPPDIQAMVPPKTKEEERLTNILSVPFLLMLVGVPLFIGWGIKAQMGEYFSFGAAFVYGYILMFIIIAWDTIVIDWIAVLLFIDIKNPPLPGTEGAKGYHDFGFHFRAGLKGMLTVAVIFAVIFASVISLLA